MAKPLTAAAVAKLRSGKERRERPDGGCQGLYLVIQPTGTKAWAFRFRRPGDRRPAKLALGTVNTEDDGSPEPDPVIGGYLTLASARRLVGKLRHQIAQGQDPAAAHIAEKQKTAASGSFEDAARDFIEQYAKKRTRRWQATARLLGLKPMDDGFEVIPRSLCGRWRDRPLSEIDEDEHLSRARRS